MLRRTLTVEHTSAGKRVQILRDPTLQHFQGSRGSKTLTKLGFNNYQPHRMRTNHVSDREQHDHAMPLLNNTNLIYNEQANDTRWIELANYLPRRTKGAAPWFRGSNTYSPLYAEQGRYEYRRYQMVTRMPSQHKAKFLEVLAEMRHAIEHEEPLRVVYALSEMIVHHYNPQHVHWQTALEGLTKLGEISKARDVWKMMERQMTWPDDKCIAAYLELCVAANKKEWAFECWNRYCTEKRFLSDGEPDPKPVSRTPFTLNRDEIIHLPRWKKFFDHDPNLDVADRNRFNTTRQLYLNMAAVMLRGGEIELFTKYFNDLEEALMTTPTPVPEPPETIEAERPQWEPSWDQDHVTSADPFVIDRETAKNALGPRETVVQTVAPRYHANEQFLLHAAATLMEVVAQHQPFDKKTGAAFVDELAERVLKRLGDGFGDLDANPFVRSYIRATSALRDIPGKEALALAKRVFERKAAASRALEKDDSIAPEQLQPSVYLAVLEAFSHHAGAAADAGTLDPQQAITDVIDVVREMSSIPTFEWALDQHLEILTMLVRCGTMNANSYFVKNVLRKFRWDARFCYQLYQEYRRHDDVEMWAELTKRMLVWTARYDVELDEATKRAIEDDYDTIGVHTRSFREVVNFAFRDMEEKRMAKDPSTMMPNPFTDYVSHALPFPDRDTGTLNEYGDLGQMRDPESGIKSAPFWMGKQPDEVMRYITSEARDPTSTVKPIELPKPWERKNEEYQRGKHPSYDAIYAGPHPEIMPASKNFRKPTRWDFKDVANQSKYKFGNPY